jgi:hypothetical protein
LNRLKVLSAYFTEPYGVPNHQMDGPAGRSASELRQAASERSEIWPESATQKATFAVGLQLPEPHSRSRQQNGRFY